MGFSGLLGIRQCLGWKRQSSESHWRLQSNWYACFYLQLVISLVVIQWCLNGFWRAQEGPTVGGGGDFCQFLRIYSKAGMRKTLYKSNYMVHELYVISTPQICRDIPVKQAGLPLCLLPNKLYRLCYPPQRGCQPFRRPLTLQALCRRNMGK